MITTLIMRLVPGESSANCDGVVEVRRSLLLRPATNSRWPDVYFEVAPDSADAITDVDGVPTLAELMEFMIDNHGRICELAITR